MRELSLSSTELLYEQHPMKIINQADHQRWAWIKESDVLHAKAAHHEPKNSRFPMIQASLDGFSVAEISFSSCLQRAVALVKATPETASKAAAMPRE